jgi:hypothetical protein
VCLFGGCFPSCSSGAQCGAHDACLNGICRANHGTTPRPICSSLEDCGPGNGCLSGRCTPVVPEPKLCQYSRRCGPKSRCFDGLCQPPCLSSTDCGTGDECASGFCQPETAPGDQCVVNGDCPKGGSVCFKGICLASCSSGAECAAHDTCLNGVCQADHGQPFSPECPWDAGCSGSHESCQTNLDCHAELTSPELCIHGVCATFGEWAPNCVFANSCGVPYHCIDARCEP